MIIYVTGVPGHGKTLRAMWHLRQEAFAGRPVHSNIEAETSTGLPRGHAPIPDQWMDVADGSVVVIDECQHRWPQRRPGSELTPEESALDEHRHRGIDFILMTQRPTGVSHHVRGNVGRHEHLRRKMGAPGAVVFRKDEAFNPKDRQDLEECDSEYWKFPSDIYGDYKSSVEHTGVYKFKLPAKAKAYLAAILCGAGLVTWAGFTVAGNFTDVPDEPPKANPKETPKARQTIGSPETQPEPDRIEGVCIRSAKRCICYPNGGDRITGQRCHTMMARRSAPSPAPASDRQTMKRSSDSVGGPGAEETRRKLLR